MTTIRKLLWRLWVANRAVRSPLRREPKAMEKNLRELRQTLADVPGVEGAIGRPEVDLVAKLIVLAATVSLAPELVKLPLEWRGPVVQAQRRGMTLAARAGIVLGPEAGGLLERLEREGRMGEVRRLLGLSDAPAEGSQTNEPSNN